MTKLIDSAGLRLDGRKLNELRPIKIDVGILKNADGSAYIEMGKNKIIAAVYGPKEVHPRHLVRPDRAIVKCRYHMASFSTDTRKNPAPSRRETEISKIIRQSLEPALILEDYPRTAIHIWVEVLQSDGGSRCAGVTAASLALADAGINMRDIVASCAAGKVDGKIVLDLDNIEDMEGETDMPVALMPNIGQVTLFQMDGIMSPAEFKEAFELALSGCRELYQLQKQALFKKYFGMDKPQVREGE